MELGDNFHVWNRCLPFYLNNAAIFFGELYLHTSSVKCVKAMAPGKDREFMERMVILAATKRIMSNFEAFLGILKQEHVSMLNSITIDVCEEVKFDIIAVFEGMGISDSTFNSALGNSDGNVYDRLISDIMEDRTNFGRPSYWRLISNTRKGARVL